MKFKYFDVVTNGNELTEVSWRKFAGNDKTLQKELKQLHQSRVSKRIWDKATPHQKLVWKACMSIPSGAVVTYAEIGRAIGKPRALRAVAQALGSNKIPIKIPCHRVISASGLGGYTCRFGIKAKQRLLKIEQTWPR